MRSREDVAAIKEGLRDGTIDIIATDHAPHDHVSKDVEFDMASSGISGLETALGLSLALVHEGVLDLTGLLAKMTVNPARLLNLPYGVLAPASPPTLSSSATRPSGRSTRTRSLPRAGTPRSTG